jgi:ATP-dependent DNA helicase RecG
MNLLDIKGVGPKTLEKFARLNIYNVEDLLTHYPTKYIDRRKRLKVIDLKLVEDTNYHCLGIIRNLKRIFLGGKRLLITGYIEDDTGNINVTWFNNPYIMSNFKDGDKVIFSGELYKGKISNPKMKKIFVDDADLFNLRFSDDDTSEFAKMEAIYPETRGLKSYQLSLYISDALRALVRNGGQIKETLPKKVLKN